MPMTNVERQKKFRERQLLNNRDEYLHTQSQYKKKQYRKNIKMVKNQKKKHQKKKKNLFY
jgi:hypothetical protein